MLKRKFLLLGMVLLILISGYLFYKFKNKNRFVEILPCSDCNLVLVSFDTLRASNVHSLGYKRNTTPTIDNLAKNSLVFTNAISASSWTLPSTMSIMTGLYPYQHKITNKNTIFANGNEEVSSLDNLSPQTKTIAEILKKNGYLTGGFTGGAGLNHEFGFNRGFDVYEDKENFSGFNKSVPLALNWIALHKNNKFFVFLHGYDIHGQFEPQGGYDKRFVDFNYKGNLTGSTEEQKKLREEGLQSGHLNLTSDDVRFLTAIYDEKIQRADAEFAKFIDGYKQMGLMDKTIFILTSDHGEELYEHGQIDHGHSLYDELVKVPLIIKYPGLKSSVYINGQVSSIDIAPTIQDILGIKDKQQMTGVSLLPMTKGDSLGFDALSETEYRFATNQKSIRSTDNWKLIRNLETNSQEVYNLKNDIKEEINIFLNERVKTDLLNRKLNSLLNK